LQRGRSGAKETDPVEPVSVAMVEATLAHANPVVRAMIQVQLLTGTRPGEIIIMQGIDLDMTGPVWIYRPCSHKTAWRGHQRVVAIGPKAQAVIKPFLKLNTEAYLFCPADACDDATWRERRKPGERYTVDSYRKAVVRACDRAFPLPEWLTRREGESWKKWRARLTEHDRAEVQSWRTDHCWHPHQLRHTRATEIRRLYGLEAAQAILGHSELGTTQVYAETDLATAQRIMREIG
jgi:integrase